MVVFLFDRFAGGSEGSPELLRFDQTVKAFAKKENKQNIIYKMGKSTKEAGGIAECKSMQFEEGDCLHLVCNLLTGSRT